MTLAPFVQIVARGKGRARVFTFDEAKAAMTGMLSDTAAPEAVGALLMVLRLRGETDDEIAGFTAALRRHAPLPKADLDWPSYAAGRTRGAPLFLLAAKLVSQAGYSVAMHGYNSNQKGEADLRTALEICPVLDDRLTYAPLETLSPSAYRLLRLRDTFGLRSCINTVLRMWNPSSAMTSVQGVFHPSYRGLQARAAAQLDQDNLIIIKGGGGEFERHPGKDTALFGLRDRDHFQDTAPALLDATRKLHEPGQGFDLSAFWNGSRQDLFAQTTVTGTAALALLALKAAPDLPAAERLAADLWTTRHDTKRT